MQKPRDVVVVRVSEQGDREDENFHSPKAQLAEAKSWSKDQGNRVVDAFEEIDVSGKLPLARRPGLRRPDRGPRRQGRRARVLQTLPSRGDRAHSDARVGARRDARMAAAVRQATLLNGLVSHARP